MNELGVTLTKTSEEVNDHSIQPQILVVTSAAQTSAQSKLYFLSSSLDMAFIGGASLVAYVFLWLFSTVDTVAKVSALAAALSVVVNWPHFMASYKLLYVDYKNLLLKKISFFSVGILIPLVLIAIVTYGLLAESTTIFSGLLRAMFIFVSWHYIKQVYGTMVMSFARTKEHLSFWEKLFLKLNLFCLGALGWTAANTSAVSFDYFGVQFVPLDLQRGWMILASFFTILTLLMVSFLFLRRYLITGRKLQWSAVVSFISIYIWTVPLFYHAAFFLIIPLFHSLQYYLFVFAFRKNQAQSRALEMGTSPLKQRQTFLQRLCGGYAFEIALGVLGFYLIPHYLDSVLLPSSQFMGTQMWVFIFTVFINLHHYFIDAAIWRRDNKVLQRFLLQKATT